MKTYAQRHDTEAKINAHAWKNPDFKKKLLANPAEALKELGMKNVPAALKIDIVNEEKNHWCIVLHAPPANCENLSEAELSKVQGGGCVFEKSNFPCFCGP